MYFLQNLGEINVSFINGTTAPQHSFFSVLIRNIIVVALCVSINYINGVQIHTFSKHHVWLPCLL